MTLKNKGNRKAQRKRRKQRLKHRSGASEYEYRLIDGNYSCFPAAFCMAHDGFLTEGLMDTHRCRQRKCPQIRKVMDGEKKENLPS
jgi:hypothetical protein